MTIVDRITGIETSVALKAPCAVAALSNITLSGTQTIEGVAVVAGDRVLTTAQTTGSENGIWVVAAQAWSRAPDFDGARDAVTGTRVYVTSENTLWGLDTAGAIVIGTTSLAWSRINEYQAGISSDTVTSVASKRIPAVVQAMYLSGHTTPGDGGGGVYKRATSEPSHDGKVQTLGSEWWELVAAEACPEMFGAAGDGATNDVAALNKLAGYQAATGAEMVLNNKWYGISTPWEINRGNVKLRGRQFISHNDPVGGLLKLEGFTGEAGIIIRANSSPTASQQTYGVEISNVTVWGDVDSYREGDGFLFEIVSEMLLMNCQAQYHEGWGVHHNGCWEVKEFNNTYRFNGLEAGSGGGRILDCSIRECANHRRMFTKFNQNWHYQELFTDGGTVNFRPSGVYTFGDLVEAKIGNTYAVAKYEAGDRSKWVGTHWNQATGSTTPCVEFGKSGAANLIRGIGLIGCYMQHNASSLAYAVTCEDSIIQLEIASFTDNIGSSSKFINATNVTSEGVISITGGSEIATEYTDPNRAIRFIGGVGVHIGPYPSGAGGDLRIESRNGTPIPVRIHGDSSDTDWFFRVGDNSNFSTSLGKYAFLIAEWAAEPATVVDRSWIEADRVTWDPLGRGLGDGYPIRRNALHDAWEPLGFYASVKSYAVNQTLTRNDAFAGTVTANAAITITVPLNATAEIPIGSKIAVIRNTSAAVSIAAEGGVTLNSLGGLTSISGQNGVAWLIKIGADTWNLSGDLA